MSFPACSDLLQCFRNRSFSRSPQTLWSFFPLLPGKLLWFLIHYTWSSVRVHLARCYLRLSNPCPNFAVSSCFFSLLLPASLFLSKQPIVLDSCLLMRCFKLQTCAFTLRNHTSVEKATWAAVGAYYTCSVWLLPYSLFYTAEEIHCSNVE